MIGQLIKRKEILFHVDVILPILTQQDYTKSIELLTHSNEILELEYDLNLSAAVSRLHKSIDHYLSNLSQSIELERLCELYDPQNTLQAA